MSEWKRIPDEKTGREYFYNTTTGVSQWEDPSTTTAAAAAQESAPKDEPKSEPVKEDFIASASFDGAKYGYIFKAGDKGTGYYLDKNTVSNTDKTAAVEERNGDWVKHYDEASKHYYWYNRISGESKWVTSEPPPPINKQQNNYDPTALKSSKDETAATLASWLPDSIRNAPSIEHKNAKPKDQYETSATFGKTGAYDHGSGLDYWARQNKPADKAGRQMSYYYDLNELDANRKQAALKKKRLREDKSIDWKAYAKKQKKKRFLARNQWLFED